MSQSIERTWKEGFAHPDNLSIPEVDNLYNKASKDLLDKFKVKMKFNLIAGVIGAVVAGGLSALMGAPWFGLWIALMLLAVLAAGVPGLKQLSLLDKGQSTYLYLKGFDSWLQGQIKMYRRIYWFFYPLLYASIAIRVGLSESGQVLVADFVGDMPGMQSWFGLPTPYLVLVAVTTILLALASGKIYQLDLDIVYGEQLRKLDELIADMEELRE